MRDDDMRRAGVSHYILDGRAATPHFPGIGRYVTNLAAGLVPLLTGNERLTLLYDAAHPPTLAQSETVHLVPARASPFSLRQQWEIPQLIRELQQLKADERNASGIIYHSPYYLMPYRPGAVTVLTVYDLIPLRLPRHSTFRARLLFRWATALALRAARMVIAISEATRSDFLSHFRLAPERIVSIPLAADPAFRPQPVGAAVRARYGLPERYALYLGSNKPHKNLAKLIEAWKIADRQLQRPTLAPERGTDANVADCRLVIAGAWDARYPEAMQQATALGLQDRVLFRGPVAEADLPALYCGAALFVFPSLCEGFGLPVLEAMACGTPVVCSDIPSLREVADDAAVMADSLDVGALAGAIIRVLSSAELRAQLRTQGLAQAARFSWKRTAQETLAIYRTWTLAAAQL